MANNTLNYISAQADITATFDKAAGEAVPFYPSICTIVPSNGAEEKYGILGAAPGVKEWLGPRVFEQMAAADFTIKNRHWESSMVVEKTAIDDDQIGMYDLAIQLFADEATYHPDELLFEIINAAGAIECFDGQFFFSASHSWGDSGVQSNLVEYECVDAAAITAAEFKASFHAALLAMLAFKNDRGKYLTRPVVGKLGSLVCVVPLAMYEAAVTAFEQVVSEGGETNVVLEKPTIVPCTSMADPAAWDLYYTGGRFKPYAFQSREPLQREVKGGDSIEFKELKLMTAARYSVGVLAWWGAVRSEMVTAEE